MRRQLTQVKVREGDYAPCAAVFVADATFFGGDYGICVFRLPHQKQNVYRQEISSETISVYQQARNKLEQRGFRFLAVVIDGRPGVRAVFGDLPVQMCHFHQLQIVTRYLTCRPKLPAGQSLRRLALTLSRTDEKNFSSRLEAWYQINQILLKERTVDPLTGRWCYTHRRLRSAYRSLKTNLPYLFTYQRYPKLNIPNTTNSLDGYFSHLKDLIKLHRGIKPNLRHQMINEILNKTSLPN